MWKPSLGIDPKGQVNIRTLWVWRAVLVIVGPCLLGLIIYVHNKAGQCEQSGLSRIKNSCGLLEQVEISRKDKRHI